MPSTSASAQVDRLQRDQPLAFALFALAAGLALNSVLGPLLADQIAYDLSESLRNQLIGLEAVSLVLVAPLAAFAGWLALRGRLAGRVLALGPATYAAYMLVQYLVGPNYERYPAVLIFQLALFVLAGFIAVRAWAALDPAALPAATERAVRTRAWVMLGLAVFVCSRYLPALAGSLTDEPLSAEFAAEPAFFWTILLMDLGIVVPCLVAAAVQLRAGSAVGSKAAYALLGWFALVPPSVAAMALVMVANDDPHASTPSAVLFTVAAVLFAAYAICVLRPLLAR